jgi:hypothetical protein
LRKASVILWVEVWWFSRKHLSFISPSVIDA